MNSCSSMVRASDRRQGGRRFDAYLELWSKSELFLNFEMFFFHQATKSISFKKTRPHFGAQWEEWEDF